MDTTAPITHVSLCAGYGGIDLGLKRCLPTLRTILAVEIEAFAVANLVAKMEAGELDPCPIWADLKALPLDCIPKGVSILSGGFPCQPFSAAGKQEGDEDPRHLFPYIKNAIRTIQPEWVFLENVEGIISTKLKGDGWADPAGTPVLLHCLRELEREGYQCAWGVFSAAECGAPHQRKRVFILAHSLGERLEGLLCDAEAEGREDEGRPTSRCSEHRREWPARPGEPQHEWEEPRVVGDSKGERPGTRGAEHEGKQRRSATASPSAELADAGHSEPSGREQAQEGQLRIPRGESTSQDCGNGELGDTECGRRQGGHGGRAEAEESGAGCEPTTGGLQTEHEIKSKLGRATDGPPSGLDPTANRVDRLRLLGNGVVPDTAEVAFRTLYKELMND